MPVFRRIGGHVGWTLLLVTLVIALIGIINLRSASLVADSTAYVSQIVWVVIGGVFAGPTAATDHRHLQRHAHVV